MTAIGEDLRAIIRRARTNPVRWGRPQGLRQADLAGMTNVSTVWIRQIESGYKHQARASTLGNICYALGIEARYLRDNGYPDIADVVADCIEAAILLADGQRPSPDSKDEAYIRDAPGLTYEEKEQLVETLRDLRKTEPLGKDLWRR